MQPTEKRSAPANPPSGGTSGSKPDIVFRASSAGLVTIQPMPELRWSKQGKLQQLWLIETRTETSVLDKRDYEWRDVPTEGNE